MFTLKKRKISIQELPHEGINQHLELNYLNEYKHSNKNANNNVKQHAIISIISVYYT